MVKTSDCFKPHVTLHAVTGLGIGLLLAGLIPSLATSGLILGVILIGASVAGHYMVK